ncbi:MAG: 50S ribosomal protein L7/L12 [Clostridiales bacterium]|jgi:large subunit ribosomal protein L7/L12|nr:50S ribosomal protein L7/L12 [Clostridiales bacterium]
MADIAKLLEDIKNLTVVDLSKLVKSIEEEFGVSAAAPAAVAATAAPAGVAAAPAAEEKTEFDVVLKEVGPNKVPVIKVVRDATGLGLVEAKAVVDGAPKAVKEGLAKAAAEELIAKFKDVGAVAELK